MRKIETPQSRYEDKNLISFCLKLNRKTDADILEFLVGKNKQGMIKRGLRMLMKSELRNIVQEG